MVFFANLCGYSRFWESEGVLFEAASTTSVNLLVRFFAFGYDKELSVGNGSSLRRENRTTTVLRCYSLRAKQGTADLTR